jgi:hypothetical protein
MMRNQKEERSKKISTLFDLDKMSKAKEALSPN